MTPSLLLPRLQLPVAAAVLFVWRVTSPSAFADDTLQYDVQLESVLEHDDGKFLWYHPRPSPVAGRNGPEVIITLQKHLHVDDYYSGLYFIRRPASGGRWSKPMAVPQLAWRHENGMTISVADVTPGWHAHSGQLLAIGCQVPYSAAGEQIFDSQSRQHQTAYAVYNPKEDSWSAWQILSMPEDRKFNFSRNACSQWLTKPDGSLLVPLYYGASASGPWSVTVAHCRFDGQQLQYLGHGDELTLDVERGLVEPSIISYDNRYFLTIRNDVGGYVSVSDEGLQWAPIQPWTFDDGEPLGSYNTQQHWLAHSGGLLLVYTRRGSMNDHIIRHRAPLFIAQVDPDRLQVIRQTERVLIPERGGELGNFGAAAIDERESWVTVSEGVWSDDARRRGAKGATFVARILWSKPNALSSSPSLP
jgi:hypothetical protein